MAAISLTPSKTEVRVAVYMSASQWPTYRMSATGLKRKLADTNGAQPITTACVDGRTNAFVEEVRGEE